MKKKIKLEKLISFDLIINNNANHLDTERYNAVLPIITVCLNKDRIGDWSGRETEIISGEDSKNYPLVNTYWYVLESGLEKAKEHFERIISNFNLTECTTLEISDSFDSENLDFQEELKNKRFLEWSWSIS